MAALWKRWHLPILIVAAIVGGAGCDLIYMPYFLLNRICGSDDKLPPQLLKLASDDKDKEVKVVICVYQGVETRPEFITADQELATLLTMDLQAMFKENKEKVVIVPPGQVKRYTDSHPQWYLDLAEAGKHFDADYLIYLEIESLSLYEPFNQFYHGRADIMVSAIDLHKPDDGPVQKTLRTEYPHDQLVPVDERNAREFEQSFLNDIARQTARYFAAYAGDSRIPDDF